MKKFISLILVILTLALTVSLAACGGGSESDSSGNNGNASAPAPQTAYDKLNQMEKDFMNALIEATDDFYNPSSVRLVEVYDARYLSTNGKLWATFKLQGTNKIGGTITGRYDIFYSESKSEYYLSETTVSTGSDDDVSVSKINAALNEYWSKQGL